MGRPTCTSTIDLVVDSRTFYVSRRVLQHCERAYIVWLAKILPVHRHPSDVASTDVSPTVAELMKQRETAIENRGLSIAAHDFRTARPYSYEENRLNKLLQNSHEKSVEHSKILCRQSCCKARQWLRRRILVNPMIVFRYCSCSGAQHGSTNRDRIDLR
jgi:hypothetical protein